MRVGVFNDHWSTAGGGEAVAASFAALAATNHDVVLLGTEPAMDLGKLARRFDVALDGLPYRRLDDHAGDGPLDLFVNASFASGQRNLGHRGSYVVLFPTPIAGPTRLVERLQVRAGVRNGLDVQYGTGFYPLERRRWGSIRWTNGNALLQIGADPGTPREVRLHLNRVLPGAGRASYSILIDGRESVAGVLEAPRRGSSVLPHVVTVRLPRRSSRQFDVRIISDTAVPDDLLGNGDTRRLGVALQSVLSPGALHRTFATLEGGGLWPTPFIAGYDRIVSISAYTKKWVERMWHRDSELIYPPVIMRTAPEKHPIILSVGRFFAPGTGHAKRQMELIQAFRQLRLEVGAEWELHLVGGCSLEDRPYVTSLRKAAADLPVFFHIDASEQELSQLYGRAALFWHAAGLGVDPERNPDRQEHFGMTAVEAMSAAAVPIVFAGGGSLETVEHGYTGYHFTHIWELVELSRQLILDPAARDRMGNAAMRAAQRFDREHFAQRVQWLIDDLAKGAP